MNLFDDLVIDLYFTIEYLMWLGLVIGSLCIACRVMLFIMNISRY